MAIGGALAFASVIIDMLPLIIEGADKAIDLVKWGREMVQTFRDEQRDPTPEEWDELDRRKQEALDQLNKRNEELQSE